MGVVRNMMSVFLHLLRYCNLMMNLTASNIRSLMAVRRGGGGVFAFDEIDVAVLVVGSHAKIVLPNQSTEPLHQSRRRSDVLEE